MKKLSGILLAGIIAAQSLLTGAISSSGVESYYTNTPTIDGEISRSTEYLYDGVTRTDYVLGTSSKYSNHGGNQVISTVEFDPRQDDLYLEVSGGGNYIHSRRTNTSTVSAYNSANAAAGKTALAATNGDLWLMVNNRIFTSGSNQNVTKGYIVPMGFSMYGGELVCTSDLSVGASWSFGVAADGTAMVGYLRPKIAATNQSSGNTITVDGINRIPENNCLVMYTDKGYQTNHSMNDAREVIIDCGYDYTVKPGATITGKVTAITEPGGTKYNCVSNRIILTARGDKLDLLAGYKVGDSVSVKVDITDDRGNTEKWYTVSDIVSGHFPHVIDGVAAEWPSSQAVNYPTSIIGVKEDGNVVMFTNYGRQISSYSEGLWISEMPQLLVEMGVRDAFMLDGGGSAAMVCETSSGGYALTGKPCDSGNAERSVVNSIILAVGPSKSGVGTTDIAINNKTAGDIVRNKQNVKTGVSGNVLSATATDFKNPSFYLDLLGGTKADSYKYMVIEGMPTEKNGGSFTLGLYPSSGRTLDPVMSSGGKLTFDCDGTWQRKVVDLSSIGNWTGRMNYIRMDLFDDSGIGAVGEGIDISRVRFFSSAASANAFANGTSSGETVKGDADGNGSLNISDVTLILKKIAGWSVTVKDQADYNLDGKVNLADVSLILKKIAG